MKAVQSPVITRVEPAELAGGRYVVVDVRSASEFRKGSVPGSVNLPLLDDAERSLIGTTYSREGSKAARLLAMDLVSPRLPSYLRSIVDRIPKGCRPAVLCWRGGERSRNVVLLLALIGVHAVQVRGGYRAHRRWVCEELEAWKSPCPVVTLHGHTGAGKSELLRTLRTLTFSLDGPRPWVVDLEKLALHRGSLLGGLNQPGQRTQRDFEALLWEELRDPQGDYLVLEGEGKRIGRLSVPPSVAAAVSSGLPIQVTASVEERTARILEEYAPHSWTDAERQAFRESLDLIGRGMCTTSLTGLRTAFEDGRFAEVVNTLLVEYYDPLYQKSSVEGRDFVLTVRMGHNPAADARRFAARVTSILVGSDA